MSANPTGEPISAEHSEPVKVSDETLLEHALQDLDSARNAFLRDMKLALLVSTFFQVLIFPRSVWLFDKTEADRANLNSLTVQSKATLDLEKSLQSLQSALTRGAGLVTKQLAQTPYELNRQFQSLDNEIKDSPAPGAPGPSGQGVSQSRSPEAPSGPADFVSDLSPEQRKELREKLGLASTDPQHLQNFRAAIAPVVRKKILEPTFSSLNSQLASSLQRPFAIRSQQVMTALDTQSSPLQLAGVKVEEIQKDLDAQQAYISKMRFIMPESDSWLESLRSKEEFVQPLVGFLNHATTELQGQLFTQRQAIETAGFRIAAASKATQTDLENVREQMKLAEDEVRGLTDEAKPFGFSHVQLRDAIVYFPVAVALVFAYLAFEYLILTGKLRRLRSTFYVLQGSTMQSAYFAAVPGTTVLSASTISLLFALAAFMSFWSAHHIHASKPLADAAPSLLYILAELLLCGCFMVILVASMTTALRFRHQKSLCEEPIS